MNIARLIKRIAYSVSFLNPGVSSLDEIDNMPLWVAVLVCLLIMITLGLLAVVAVAYVI